ncbi:MAG: hypothetical protein K9L89_05375 [Kiritimatiellales bacterium]|nr:hypothetical protein [Kiritimatiellales bacterium]
MILQTKPDFAEVKQRWNAFWEDELLDRPMVCAMVPKDGGRTLVDVNRAHYWNPCTGNYDAQLDLIDQWADATLFMGELVPYFSPDHGPDQFGAWMGSELKFSPDNIQTNWAEPVLKDWESFLPVSLQEDNPTWQSILKYASLLKERGAGKYIVGMADMHSHMDAFSALRHPDKLCMDLYDDPELVKEGCSQARALYAGIYEKIYAAGGMSKETGTIGWLPLWCEGKTAAVQCDFSVFLSNEMWREFVLPGILEEVAYLDRCFYHLDGKQQLIHLDDLLAIPDLDGIQWVPGEGQPEMFSRHWRDVLKKILAAGKKVIVYGDMDIDAVKEVHCDLGAKNVVYDIFGRTRTEIDEILDWLTGNT